MSRVLALLAVAAAMAQTPPLVSPEVHSDGRVTFQLRAPKAAEVTLRGEWMPPQASEKLVRDPAGVWSVTLGPLPPDIYSYSFSIDGAASPDPANNQVKASSRGPGSSVLVVPGGSRSHETRDVPHGSVHAHWYRSPEIGATRRFLVYVPPEYDREPSARYPVLYLLHGNGDTEEVWSEFGRANFILDNLLAERKVVPMLVVMPYGHTVPPHSSRPRPGRATPR
jgi:enterochelin esterase family protein